MSTSRATAFLLALFLLITFGCTDEPAEAPAPPEAPVVATADPIASGKASYEQYCQACHGADGKGTGEIRDDLATPPPDLTQLKANHGGTFPVDLVYQTIDGRKMVEAHGTREMPVWGNIWTEDDGQPVAQDVVDRRINELVEYLRSIQE